MNGLSLELDPATNAQVEHLAKNWGVSKEDAIRRAVAQADASAKSPPSPNRLEAFRELQHALQLTPEKAAAWQDSVRQGRR